MPQNTKSQIAPASYNFLQSHCYISFGRASKHLWSFICLLLLKSLTSVKYVKFTSSNWLIEDNIQILLINVSFPFDPNKAHMNVSEISQFVISYFSEIYWRYVRKLATQIVRIRVILFRRPRSFTDSSNDKRGCVLKIKVQRVIPEVQNQAIKTEFTSDQVSVIKSTKYEKENKSNLWLKLQDLLSRASLCLRCNRKKSYFNSLSCHTMKTTIWQGKLRWDKSSHERVVLVTLSPGWSISG